MSEPVRLQLKRVAGFDLQKLSRETNGLEAVKAARPGPFGNPFSIRDAADILDCRDETAHRQAVAWFREWITNPTSDDYSHESGLGGHLAKHTRILAELPKLRGKNLACFRAPGLACHADVLLELANAPVCEEVSP